MTIKVREANCQSDLKDTKQKYMELETQNHICTNQIRRMDEENKLLKTQTEHSIGASHQVSVHLAKQFQRRRFLEINQPETRIAYGSHVC
jgi:beta-N-acetylglucosaminidase